MCAGVGRMVWAPLLRMDEIIYIDNGTIFLNISECTEQMSVQVFVSSYSYRSTCSQTRALTFYVCIVMYTQLCFSRIPYGQKYWQRINLTQELYSS